MSIEAVTTTPAVSITVTPTVTAGAYSSGQCIGGLIALPGAARNATGFTDLGGLVQSVTATFSSGVTPSIDCVLFAANPSGSTLTDHVTAAIVAADLPKIEAVIHLTDTASLGSTSIVQAAQCATPFMLTNSNTAPNTLYAALIIRAAATLTSTSDMTVTVNILQN